MEGKLKKCMGQNKGMDDMKEPGRESHNVVLNCRKLHKMDTINLYSPNAKKKCGENKLGWMDRAVAFWQNSKNDEKIVRVQR
jgi:hypothetical protein